MPDPSRIPRRLLLLLLPALAACADSPVAPAARPMQPINGLITAGSGRTCALRSDGEAFCWGATGFGTYAAPEPVPGDLRFIELTAGAAGATCGITPQLAAFCWGTYEVDRNEILQFGTAPTALSGGLSFVHIGTGGDFSCGLTTAGEVYCWGGNYLGELGAGEHVATSWTPLPVAGDHRFTRLAVGGTHTCALTSGGEPWCWGEVQFHGGGAETWWVPTRVNTSLAFSSISAGGGTTCALTPDGHAYCWGAGQAGQIGDGARANRAQPTEVAAGQRFTSVSVGDEYACGITRSADAYCWGYNLREGYGPFDSTAALTPQRVVGGVAFRRVSVGAGDACGLAQDGSAYCWGYVGWGQLGNGETDRRDSPVAVPGQSDAVAVYASGYSWSGSSCALHADGAAWCWGANDAGQLGDGTTTDRLEPVQVAGGHRFAVLAQRGEHTCGIAADGSAWCWGRNTEGELGTDDDFGKHSEPTPVSGGLRFLDISAGETATCGLTVLGRPYCWGQLDPDMSAVELPQRVATPDSVRFTAIAVGAVHACALAADSIPWCWGSAALGRDTPGGPEPAPVQSNVKFLGITASRWASCALSLQRTPYCWGVRRLEWYGPSQMATVPTEVSQVQLESLRLAGEALDPCGIGLDGQAYCAFAPVASGLQLADISPADGHICAVSTDGVVYCWGSRTRGQVGDGFRPYRAQPQRVLGFKAGG